MTQQSILLLVVNWKVFTINSEYKRDGFAVGLTLYELSCGLHVNYFALVVDRNQWNFSMTGQETTEVQKLLATTEGNSKIHKFNDEVLRQY